MRISDWSSDVCSSDLTLTAFPSAEAVPADGLFNLTAKETVMPQIGQFTAENENFVGRVHTLTLYRELTIVPAEPSDAENAPAYRVLHGAEDGPEVGAGWKDRKSTRLNSSH